MAKKNEVTACVCAFHPAIDKKRWLGTKGSFSLHLGAELDMVKKCTVLLLGLANGKHKTFASRRD